MGRRKIIFGSVFFLFIILLMPCTSGIQKTIVEEGFKLELREKIKSINLNDLDDIKYPFLYELVYLIYAHREMRLNRVLNTAVEAGFGYFEVRHPLLFLWAFWLGITSAIWLSFWKGTSDNLGWGWFDDYSNLFDINGLNKVEK